MITEAKLEKYALESTATGMATITFPKLRGRSFMVKNTGGFYDPKTDSSTFHMAGRPSGRTISFNGKLSQENSVGGSYVCNGGCVHSNGHWMQEQKGDIIY